jgi:hypothetical protein
MITPSNYENSFKYEYHSNHIFYFQLYLSVKVFIGLTQITKGMGDEMDFTKLKDAIRLSLNSFKIKLTVKLQLLINTKY